MTTKPTKPTKRTATPRWSVVLRVEAIYEVTAKTEKKALEAARKRLASGDAPDYPAEESFDPSVDEMGEE